jgi:putative flippase GtrA
MATTYPDGARETRPRPTASVLIANLDTLIARTPRLIRFGAVGSTCALLQLLALGVLGHLGLELHVANILAFILSTQVNFALSSAITWRDRRMLRTTPGNAARRLAGYNALALGSLLINQAVFAVALPHAPYLVAGVAGILAGMLLTYAISGQLLFRRQLVAATEPGV